MSGFSFQPAMVQAKTSFAPAFIKAFALSWRVEPVLATSSIRQICLLRKLALQMIASRRFSLRSAALSCVWLGVFLIRKSALGA